MTNLQKSNQAALRQIRAMSDEAHKLRLGYEAVAAVDETLNRLRAIRKAYAALNGRMHAKV